jgi:permuted papain-like amidase YaeF/Yiix C92 family enzyme
MNVGLRIVPLALVISGYVEVARAGPPMAPATSLPVGLRIREGDLVFHRSRSAQSHAVALATGSAYTHMGVVLVFDGQPAVFEAVQPVKLTPLPVWIARGEKGRVVVKRLRDAERVLTPSVTQRMRRLASRWLGRPYDLQFRWDDERLYCSELVYKLYERTAGIRIGALQKAKELNLRNGEVQRLLARRFGGTNPSFDPEETVISPQAMFDDPRLVTVFKN